MRTSLDLWRETSPFRIFDDFDQVFSRFLNTGDNVRSSENEESPRVVSPAYEIDEFDTHFMLSLDMPGLSREDLKIELKEDQLTIGGERKKGDKLYARLQKTFVLPSHVDTAKIEARYEDGVLDIVLPKSEAAKPRTIRIQNGHEGFFSRFLPKKSVEIKDVNERAS